MDRQASASDRTSTIIIEVDDSGTDIPLRSEGSTERIDFPLSLKLASLFDPLASLPPARLLYSRFLRRYVANP